MVEQATKTPTFNLSFEDLRQDPEPVLQEMFAFMLDVPSLEGTVLGERIKQVCATDGSKKAAYKLKSTSSSLSRNNSIYTEE